MKKTIILISSIIFAGIISAHAQNFIQKAVIEFEVKTNVKKTIGNGSWAEMFKDAMPQFMTGYYKFTFSGNKSIYQFDRWADGPKVPEFFRRDDEMSVYYVDHGSGKILEKKGIFGSEINVEDSIPAIKWRLTNESRVIAGFNCRKAVGVILDSIYVFAFYSDEIIIPGGPCSVSGLPGMVLGLTIPRLYTSYIATKVMVNAVKEDEIKLAVEKKNISLSGLSKMMTERLKEWSNDDDEDSKNWRNLHIWKAVL